MLLLLGEELLKGLSHRLYVLLGRLQSGLLSRRHRLGHLVCRFLGAGQKSVQLARHGFQVGCSLLLDLLLRATFMRVRQSLERGKGGRPEANERALRWGIVARHRHL